eukprot:6192780-Pleurochrysis_carterae.AAC.2
MSDTCMLKVGWRSKAQVPNYSISETEIDASRHVLLVRLKVRVLVAVVDVVAVVAVTVAVAVPLNCGLRRGQGRYSLALIREVLPLANAVPRALASLHLAGRGYGVRKDDDATRTTAAPRRVLGRPARRPSGARAALYWAWPPPASGPDSSAQIARPSAAFNQDLHATCLAAVRGARSAAGCCRQTHVAAQHLHCSASAKGQFHTLPK